MLLVLILLHGPTVAKGGVSLLVFVQRRLGSLCTEEERCRSFVGVAFVRPLFLCARGIGGVGIVPWLRLGLGALWAVGRR